MKISVVVITKNEAHNLRACLESVSWCDRAIIVDSGSTDGTVELARSLGADVFVTDSWPGFGPQKNIALSKVDTEWVLSLDADERVTPELRADILSAIDSATQSVYAMPRLSQFCGRFIRHAGWYPDRVVRLFRRGAARFSDDLVHEKLIFEGTVGMLEHPLLHYSYRDYSDVLRKIEAYSSAGARQAYAAGKRATPGKALAHGVWAFLRTYVVRLGVLDGVQGFGVACMNAQASYYKYIKLWHLTRTAQPPTNGT
ncbi:MAG: glycosyltransferase family 2 protein [Pseudomonadota bacterium]|uniref:glycosyltransferase family 2 protein n=1 Tax=Ralstonia pickettii TaxID=329 RepID=UPI002714F1C2|nr:glycosyltransferase family 2 protein [Ralstonia pickettii]MEE2979658.1 glycosyltransferase family 2 protein [Pseudomonadota bacterium]WKZ84255.1 glycosyltransferase family 2 protein [Ralstonia pickettii]